MAVDRPVRAPETAEEPTIPAVAALAALVSAAHSNPAQTFALSPTPSPDSRPCQAVGNS